MAGLNWNDLQYVLALRDGRTIKHAAHLLRTNPTTVSRHIKSLTQELGTTLFAPHKDGTWHITAEGRKLARIAEDLKAGLASLADDQDMDQEPRSVKITSLEFLLTHYIAPHIRPDTPALRGVELSLYAADRRLSLAYGEADIALRFGRPTEGQLLAAKVADVGFHVYHGTSELPGDWVGLPEEFDWLPEMQLGFAVFGKPPAVRVSAFATARETALASQFAAVGPAVVMLNNPRMQVSKDTPGIAREVWSVIHETRRHSKQLATIREWIKDAMQHTRVHQAPVAAPRLVISEKS